MSEPILLQIDGHAYPNHLPLDFADDNITAWVQAFEHVVRYIAPHGLSFVLHGRGSRIHFQNGIPAKNDVDRLCKQLRKYQDDRACVVASLPLAA